MEDSRWLKTSLVQVAWAASHTRNSYFSAQFHRLVGRRGKKRALVAVAHSLLEVIHHLLLTGCQFNDLGADYFDKRDEEKGGSQKTEAALETFAPVLRSILLQNGVSDRISIRQEWFSAQLFPAPGVESAELRGSAISTGGGFTNEKLA